MKLGILGALAHPKKFGLGLVDTFFKRLKERYKIRVTAEFEIIDKTPGEPDLLDELERGEKS